MQSVQLAAPSSVFATPPGDGAFQLEGNAVDDGAGDDWVNVFNGNDSAIDDVLPDRLDRPALHRGVQGHPRLADQRLGSQSVPDKDDILHAYAAVYDGGGDPIHHLRP